MRIAHPLVAPLVALCLVTGCQSTGGKSRSQQDHEQAQKHWAGARANVLANMAKEQYEGGNFEKSRATTNDALKMDPDNAELRVLSARLAIEQGNLELADRELVHARRLAPKNAEADYLSGVVCQRWQRSQDAHDYYRSASEKQPNELAYLMAQAETLVTLGRADEALALLQAKVIFFEYSATIRDAVGQLHMQKGKYDLAVESLRQASILAADDTGIREHLAMAHFRNKQYREAADVLARLLKDDRFIKRADLHLALAESHMQLNKPRDARDSFELATQLAPNHAQAWSGLGKAALRLNDLPRAELAAKRALTIEPGSGESNLLLGYVRLRQSKFPEALASFKKASALDPEDSVSHCMIGMTLEKMGKADEALKAYAKALKAKPGDELATKLMAEIRLDQ